MSEEILNKLTLLSIEKMLNEINYDNYNK